MDYLEFIVQVSFRIPDKGQVTVRYYGLSANGHRGKVKKASLETFPLRIVEDEPRSLPAKGWAEMIHKVCEVDPLLRPHCCGTMRVIAFLTDTAVLEKIINRLNLTFIASKPLPLGLPPRNISWPPRPPLSVFRDLLLTQKERSGRFPALQAPRQALRMDFLPPVVLDTFWSRDLYLLAMSEGENEQKNVHSPG